jgi:hypothetical protein
MSSNKKIGDIVQRLYEANDIPVQLGELATVYGQLMKLGFTTQAQRLREARDNLIEHVLEAGLDELFLTGVDGLKLGASDAMETKLRYKKLKMKKRQTRKVWLCCKKPHLIKTRKGARVWMAACQFRNTRTRKVQTVNVTVGKDPAKKPKAVFITQGKRRIKMRWCTGANRR